MFELRIALINENSQAPKNGLICEALEKVVTPMGEVYKRQGQGRLHTGRGDKDLPEISAVSVEKSAVPAENF